LVEKVVGARRENGALKLKRLTARHLRIIGAHLSGLSIEQVAAEQRVTISTVSRVLNDPLAKTLLDRVYKSREEELHALAGQAVAAVRDGLDKGQGVTTRLRAVKTYAQLREVLLPKGVVQESAEDVIQRMLAKGTIINGDVNVQVNNGVQS
jgi:hypothetical protein